MKAKIYLYITFLLSLILVSSCDDSETTAPQPAGTFTASKTTANIGEDIQFTNTSVNATAFVWSFGDGSTSKSISPKKAYTSAGTFEVSLLSTGVGGSVISSTSITILPDPDIFFMEVGAELLRRFSIRSTDDPTTFLDMGGFAGAGIAYDNVHQKIYFSDYDTRDEGKIWSINLDGTDLTAIAEDLVEPYGVAVDAEGGKVYWADEWQEDNNYEGHIYRSNLDGSGMEPVVTMVDAQFRSVALDPAQNKMYFYDVYNENLHVANMDGTNESVIVPGVYGYAVQVDTQNGKVYFDDQNEAVLYRANLDGSNLEVIDDDGTRIYGISIDNENNKLYWSGRDTGEIYEAELDGTHKKVLKAGLSSPRGLFLKK
jgi:PKD repeat protein